MATINDPWPKRSLPNGHPADGMTLEVELGGGAWMTILDPRSFADGGLGWSLTYSGDVSDYRHVAASALGSYDYLLSADITMTEATRRLREARRIRALACKTGGQHADR